MEMGAFVIGRSGVYVEMDSIMLGVNPLQMT